MEVSFRKLHKPGDPFILANAWDVGSARMMAALGAKAIASTSAGHAFTLGRPDMGTISRDEAIGHAVDLIAATDLPVSGDLENGFGHDSDSVVETIKQSSAAGLAGCGIEDTMLPDIAPYDFSIAVERIEAASSAARSLEQDFVLTARADGLMNGQYDFAEALRRAKAFADVGADVVYIPLLRDLDQVRELCLSVDVPVNVLCTRAMVNETIDSLGAAGVARISLGSMLSRVTHKAILDASKEMFANGSFISLSNAASGDEIDALLEQGAGEKMR